MNLVERLLEAEQWKVGLAKLGLAEDRETLDSMIDTFTASVRDHTTYRPVKIRAWARRQTLLLLAGGVDRRNLSKLLYHGWQLLAWL